MYIQKLILLSTDFSPAALALALVCTTGFLEDASRQTRFTAPNTQMHWQN